MVGQRRRRWARIGPALGQCIVFCTSPGEDIKTVAQLTAANDDLVTVDHLAGSKY